MSAQPLTKAWHGRAHLLDKNDRRDVEREFGLPLGSFSDTRVIDRADRAELDRARAALVQKQLTPAMLEPLAIVATYNGGLKPEIAAFVADAKAAGVDPAPYDAAMVSLASSAAAAPQQHTPGTALRPIAPSVQIIDASTVASPIVLPRRVLPGLTRGTAALLAGAPGVGKSGFSVGCAVTIATERASVLGIAADWTGPTVYGVFEDTPDVSAARIDAALERDKATRADLKHAIALWSDGAGPAPPLFGRDDPRGPLRTLSGGEALIAYCKALKPALIVIDTLSAAFVGVDENSAQDMAAVMRWCSKLAIDADAAVVAVHHLSKAAEERVGSQSAVRGSGAITASARAVLGLDVAVRAQERGVAPGTLELRLVKSNHEQTGHIGFFRKVGVNLPAIDPRDPTAHALHSVLALNPVRAVALDPLSGVDVASLLGMLRVGVGGDPTLPWVPDKRSPHAVHDLLRDTFGIAEPELADRAVTALVDRGLIAFEDRLRKNGKARKVIVVQPDAEKRAAPVQIPEGALSGGVSAFD